VKSKDTQRAKVLMVGHSISPRLRQVDHPCPGGDHPTDGEGSASSRSAHSSTANAAERHQSAPLSNHPGLSFEIYRGFGALFFIDGEKTPSTGFQLHGDNCRKPEADHDHGKGRKWQVRGRRAAMNLPRRRPAQTAALPGNPYSR